MAEACGSRTQTIDSQLTANDDVAASAKFQLDSIGVIAAHFRAQLCLIQRGLLPCLLLSLASRTAELRHIREALAVFQSQLPADRKTAMSLQALPTAISRWARSIRLWQIRPRVLVPKKQKPSTKHELGIKKARRSGLRNVPAAPRTARNAKQRKKLLKQSRNATPLWPGLPRQFTDSRSRFSDC
jgi:hypothetical protein